jgi:Tol biopolymer transport system component
MTAFDRFEAAIPELMDELAPASVPDYIDDLLRATAGRRQRPAWTYPERWLPVDITARPLVLRAVPWRPMLIAAIVLLALAVALVAIVGSRPSVPAPFGPAGNGLLVYRADDGAIQTVDPTTGARSTIAAASAGLGNPTLSRNGRRIAFAPLDPSRPIVVTDLDGSHATTIRGSFMDVAAFDWSPDDSHLAFTATDHGRTAITVAAADGSAAATLPLQRDVRDLWYLPDGRLAIIAADEPAQSCDRDEGAGPSDCALFVVRPDGTGLNPVARAADVNALGLNPSPDGTKVVNVEWTPPTAAGRLHLIDVASHRDTLIPVTGTPAEYGMNHAWFSPDGKSILFDYFEVDGDRWGVVPTAGGQPVRIGPKFETGTNDAIWAPDGRSVLAYYGADSGSRQLWQLDPTGGGGDRQLSFDLPMLPAWQRVATR